MRRPIWIGVTTLTLLLGLARPGGALGGPTFSYVQTIWPTALPEQFGLSVAVSGDTAVVGAQGFTQAQCPPPQGIFIDLDCFLHPPPVVSTGAAYVFVRSNGEWAQQQKLVAPDGSNDGFGSAVAISGDRIVVGAPGREAAYLFGRRAGEWSMLQRLQPMTTAPDALFGSSVAISRDAIVVGAPRQDQRSLVDTGSAYVFENSGAAWVPQELVNQPSGAGDLFGYAVAISGDMLVVGAPIDDGHGTAVVFTRSGGVWTRQGSFAALDGSAGDGFGISVAIGGSTVVVGAPGDDEFGLADSGSVYVFTGRNGVWSQQQKIVNPYSAADDQFGASVAISDGKFVVGIPNDELFGKPRHGTAVVFESSGGVWREHQWFLFDTGVRHPFPNSFGRTVAMSEGTVVIGEPVLPITFALIGWAHIFATNTRPVIYEAAVQSPPPLVVTRQVIATVFDAQDPHSALTVTVNGAASATVNGVTVSGISIDASGTVTADVIAISANASATFVVRVTDTTGLFAEATLVVRNFTIGG